MHKRRRKKKEECQSTGIHVCFSSEWPPPLCASSKRGVLVEQGDANADTRDEWGQTPLSLAAERGHEAVVRLLLERDDVEADSKNKWSQTALSLAAGRGHEAVVEPLVERNDVNAD